MARIPRIILEDVPYHITQRGNARQQVFFDDKDHQLYLDLLQTQAKKSALRLLGYCLMPNHVHLVAIPSRANAMSCALGRTHADFARHFNLKKRACGHVWQARYFSTPLDNTHLWQALAYVERNPVRAQMTQDARQYKWSSARQHLGLPAEHGMAVDMMPWEGQYDKLRWQQVLETSVGEEAFGRRLQEASRRGRPLGDGVFIEQLESLSGRRLRPLPVGRPKKMDEENSAPLVLRIGA